MPTDYLNLNLNDDIKDLATEYAYLRRDFSGVYDALDGKEVRDFEDVLLDIYLHSVRSQVILKKIEGKLDTFIKE